MHRIKILFISVGICLLLQVMDVRAGWFGADFSADVVQGTAQGQELRGRMYVGAGRVRTEMKQDGQSMIEIIDPSKGLAWVVDAGRKLYQQRTVPQFPAGRAKSRNPCDAVEGAVCQQLADEQLNGRNSQKWLLRIDGKERLQWHDSRHGFAIQIVEGGQLVMAMIFIGEQSLNGRNVERWRALQYSGKTVVENEQWYDPQLNIAIRLRAKDGSFRELRNIQLATQQESLFVLPQDYQRLDATAR